MTTNYSALCERLDRRIYCEPERNCGNCTDVRDAATAIRSLVAERDEWERDSAEDQKTISHYREQALAADAERDSLKAALTAAQAELAEEREAHEETNAALKEEVDETERLKAELAECRRDAERWRHIKGRSMRYTVTIPVDDAFQADVDAAIQNNCQPLSGAGKQT